MQRDDYVFMTAVVDIGWVTKKVPLLGQLIDRILLRTPQAFGRGPNALPAFCNGLKQKSFGSPG